MLVNPLGYSTIADHKTTSSFVSFAVSPVTPPVPSEEWPPMAAVLLDNRVWAFWFPKQGSPTQALLDKRVLGADSRHSNAFCVSPTALWRAYTLLMRYSVTDPDSHLRVVANSAILKGGPLNDYVGSVSGLTVLKRSKSAGTKLVIGVQEELNLRLGVYNGHY